MEDIANKKAFPQLLKTIILLVDENLKLKVMLSSHCRQNAAVLASVQTSSLMVVCHVRSVRALESSTCRALRV